MVSNVLMTKRIIEGQGCELDSYFQQAFVSSLMIIESVVLTTLGLFICQVLMIMYHMSQ